MADRLSGQKGGAAALNFVFLCALFPAGILAGVVGSVAGLASLVSYPALLAVGIPPVVANVTNTTALVLNGFGSLAASRRELKGRGRELARLLPLTVGGSVAGGLLLLAAPASAFEHVVPFFILGAAYLILRPELPRRARAPKPAQPEADTPKPGAPKTRARKFGFGAAVALVGAYTGYFGAAGGVVMLALLLTDKERGFAESNALKNVTLGASNLAATLLFVFRAHINWLAALPMAAGFFIGGALGPAIVRRVPARLLRFVIAAGAAALAVSLFIQAYFR